MAAQFGIAPQRFVAGTEISKGNAIWVYYSSDASSDVGGVVGYVVQGGAQPSSNPGQMPIARQSLGMVPGDLFAVVQSSAGNSPGLVTWHCVKGSTFNQASTSASSAMSTGAGFNVTVSSAASS
jgi:hypothetical protein